MTHVSDNKIGRYMVAVGAIIEHQQTGKVLVMKRNDEFHKDTWETIYGRIDQNEDLDTGLMREVTEETGIADITIKKLLRIWRIYRGEKSAENEIYGFTFYCQTDQDTVTLSSEHSQFKWVSPAEALNLLTITGIKKDMEYFINHKQDQQIVVTGPDDNIRLQF